ncbi:MAG: hypothetical protein RL430_1558 [Actinomycetota bacterium]|jgi:hypothetical protein
MPERNRYGFSTPEALRDGARDQYAVLRNQTRIDVELYWQPDNRGGAYYVRHRTTRAGRIIEQSLKSYEILNEARDRFRRLVRANP